MFESIYCEFFIYTYNNEASISRRHVAIFVEIFFFQKRKEKKKEKKEKRKKRKKKKKEQRFSNNLSLLFRRDELFLSPPLLRLGKHARKSYPATFPPPPSLNSKLGVSYTRFRSSQGAETGWERKREREKEEGKGKSKGKESHIFR